MVLVFLYFALFLIVHLVAKQFKTVGAARLFQLVACFILLFGFFGFRDITVLNDTPHYYGFYYEKTKILSYQNESVFTYHLLDKFEYGFQILIHFLIKYISKEPYTIIILSSFVFSIGNILFISKHTKQIALACFMMIVSGVWFDQYSMIRQAFAIMFFYRAYPYLKAKKYKPYTLLIIIASLFHISALILLILPILQQIHICPRNTIIVLITAAIIALSIHIILSLIGLSDTFYFKMSMKRTALPIAAIFDGLLMTLLFVAYTWFRRKELLHTDASTEYWIYILGLCICIVALAFLPFYRLNAYLWPFAYIFLFQSLEQHKSVFGTLMILLLIRISVVFTFKNEWNHVIPYSFFNFNDRVHHYILYLQKEQ